MLKFTQVEIMSADLGAESTLPDIHDISNDPFFICEDSVSQEERKDIGKGMIKTILPYKMQNLYNRNLKPVMHDAVVLENDYLKAVFLPKLGGRLWSLYDKKLKKDIVYKNDVFRASNLALRNAWLAGGVEFNIGMKGHSPFTCSPMFVQKQKNKSGNDVLKMYEYESIRKVVYSISATLDKDELVIHIEIENTNAEPTYMYWWSNIAVEQNEGTRVFVPANKSFITSYKEGGYVVSKRSIPMVDGKDLSYAVNAREAIDYFYDIDKDRKKWIASIEENGVGLLHSSGDKLIGRKTFLWGQNAGGRHWNEWLTEGRDYLEIQAGLRKTQFEHFLMDGNSTIAWNEIYKGIKISPELQRGDFFEVSNEIDKLVTDTTEKDYLFDIAESDELKFMGSGTGYLEEQLTGRKLSATCKFPKASLTPDLKYFEDLLNGVEGDDYEIVYTRDAAWKELILKKSKLTQYDYYMLGIIDFCNEDYDAAMDNFNKSLEVKKEYYTLAAISLMYCATQQNYAKAYEYAKASIALNPDYLPLAAMYGEAAIRANEPADFIAYWETSADNVKNDGRIRMYLGQCHVMMGNTEKAKEYINEELVISDIREGEYAISNVWVSLYKKEMARETGRDEDTVTDAEVLEKHPVPYIIDFRMH